METHTLPNQSVLRKKAEEKMTKRNYKLSPESSKADLLSLNHELLVHQIELEEQNDELAKAREHAEIILEKYIDLYDLTPIGYFTLTNTGEIVEANLYAATMLGKKHASLVGSRFGFYVTEDSKPVFNKFIEDVIRTKSPKKCVINLNIHQHQNTHALLTGHITRNGKYCLITVIDISFAVINPNS
jgi:PAS domain-containing protein